MVVATPAPPPAESPDPWPEDPLPGTPGRSGSGVLAPPKSPDVPGAREEGLPRESDRSPADSRIPEATVDARPLLACLARAIDAELPHLARAARLRLFHAVTAEVTRAASALHTITRDARVAFARRQATVDAHLARALGMLGAVARRENARREAGA